jgi:predicted nucleic acid-binding protein
MSKVALDTNVLVFLFDEYAVEKQVLAGTLVECKAVYICTGCI